MKLTASTTIDAPIERVWETLTDENKFPLWIVNAPFVSYPEGARRADPTGQQFILTFPIAPTGRQPRKVYGEHLVFSFPDRLVTRYRDEEKTTLVTYALRSEGPRTTIIAVRSESSEFRPAFVKFFARLLAPLFQRMTKSALSRLKHLVESDEPNWPTTKLQNP